MRDIPIGNNNEQSGFKYRPPDESSNNHDSLFPPEILNHIAEVDSPANSPYRFQAGVPINTPDSPQIGVQTGSYFNAQTGSEADLPTISPVVSPVAVPPHAPLDPTVVSQGDIPEGAPVRAGYNNPPIGTLVVAPLERADSPTPTSIPQLQHEVGFHGNYQQGDPLIPPKVEDWREPSYSQTHENVSNMYTPGIYVNRPYSRRRDADVESEQKNRKTIGVAGWLVGAACLVLICVVLSGVAAYIVMDYRIERGDFIRPVNQVVLGGANSSNQQSEGQPAAVATSGIGMRAEDIYDMACSQVVGIRTEAENVGSFFYSQSTTTVSGSGFIISSDGYILTNYHVVEFAYLNDLPLFVSLNDGTDFEANVIGYESSNDVALIKIEASGLNAAVKANSDNIRVGQPVYAVGNPFGDLVYTMTEGIVSALDRVVTVDRKSISTFQFSAAVNSGNSGGPVYDINGEVIGIVSAKIMGDYVEGIGFAIPINDAFEIAAELIEHGYITGRPLIGIKVESVTRGHAEYYGWVVGAYVRSITPDSAAEKAEMAVGDIIIAIDDTAVDSREALVFALRKYKAGDTTSITVWRAGTEIVLTITFDENLAAGQPQRTQPEQTDQPTPDTPIPVP